MTPFSQEMWACRCEWGPGAPEALAPADVTIVVDVFSFTTCVDVAVSCGVVILPYPWNDPSAADFARAQGAELAGRGRQARYSLAPASYLEAPQGLRCVLPSPNGAVITLNAARTASAVLAGSLRNAPPWRTPRSGWAGRSTSFPPANDGLTARCGRRWRIGSVRARFYNRSRASDRLKQKPPCRFSNSTATC